MLRAAKPGAGLPSKEFLARMQGSIGELVGEQSARPQPAARPSRRSLLLTGAAGVAAGVAAAVGLQRFVPKPVAPGPAQALVEKGAWKPVKALAELPQSTPVAFRSGAIEGFLIRHGDEVKGLSAVCTHMGCILNYSKFRDQFECPCHGATFETTGRATDQYDTPLPRLHPCRCASSADRARSTRSKRRRVTAARTSLQGDLREQGSDHDVETAPT